MQDTEQDYVVEDVTRSRRGRRDRWWRRRRPGPSREETTAIDYMTAFAGTVYAVLLAMAVVVLWQSTDGLGRDVREEAAGLSALTWVADRLPPAQRAELRDSIADYVDVTLHQEWPPRHGLASSSRVTLATIRARLIAFTPSDPEVSGQRDKALNILDDIDAAAQERLAKSGRGFPKPMLAALVGLSAVTASNPFTMGLRRQPLALVKLAVTVTLVAASLMLVLALNSPYQGTLHSVDPSPLQAVLTELSRAG